jgi:hypothetical protein
MSFFGDLFGGKSGVNAANAAADAQRASITAGYTQGREALQGGYARADDILSGYEAPGKAAYGQYADSIGVNGAQGYARAKAGFDSDPFLAGSDASTALALRNQFRQYNARGMGDSGANRAALARTNADLYAGRVADYRNRLMQMGQQGAQYGAQRAGYGIDQGNRLADMAIGQNTAYGNIEAQRQGNIYGAKQQGMNNLMSGLAFLGGSAIKAFAPTAGGASAAGNMSNALMSNGWK